MIDCPDTFEILTDLWRQYVMYIQIKIREAASSSQKKDEVYWEKCLEDYVDRCYSVLYADKFEYDLNDPCKGSYGNPILFYYVVAFIIVLVSVLFFLCHSYFAGIYTSDDLIIS